MGKTLLAYLAEKRIETRPIMAGNIAEQPVASVLGFRKVGDLKNSSLIMRNGFFFGNHHKIKMYEREYIVECISNFINKSEYSRNK